MTDCKTHHSHDHVHGPGCGHQAIEHDGHVDYLHDGHLHHLHDSYHDLLLRHQLKLKILLELLAVLLLL